MNIISYFILRNHWYLWLFPTRIYKPKIFTVNVDPAESAFLLCKSYPWRIHPQKIPILLNRNLTLVLRTELHGELVCDQFYISVINYQEKCCGVEILSNLANDVSNDVNSHNFLTFRERENRIKTGKMQLDSCQLLTETMIYGNNMQMVSWIRWAKLGFFIARF